jgi:hypothetical protein
MDPLLVLVLFSQAAILGVLGWGVLAYIRVRNHLVFAQRVIERGLKMNIDELLTTLPESESLETPPVDPPATSLVGNKRACIAAHIAGGQRFVFKGKTVTLEMVDGVSDADVEELSTRVEARLGAAMSKSLGSSLLQLYTGAVSALLPIPAEEKKVLAKELEEDPLVCTWLQATCCELYYRYGPMVCT